MATLWAIYFGSCILYLMVYFLHRADARAGGAGMSDVARQLVVSLLPVVNTVYAAVYLAACVADLTFLRNKAGGAYDAR